MPTNQDESLVRWGNHLYAKVSSPKATYQHQCYLRFLEELSDRLRHREKDGMIAVTGERGHGKTTFGLGASLIMNLPQFGIYFDMKDHLCPSIENLGDMVESASVSSESSYLIDEAIDVADSRSGMSRINKAFTSFTIRARKCRNLYWWCIPDFVDLDSRIRNRVIQYWVHVFWQSQHEERDKRYAVAALFRKDLNPFNPDKWGLKEIHQHKAITNPDDLLKLMKRARSFVATIAFPILPEAIEDQYKELSFKALKDTGAEFAAAFRKSRPTPEQAHAQEQTPAPI